MLGIWSDVRRDVINISTVLHTVPGSAFQKVIVVHFSVTREWQFGFKHRLQSLGKITHLIYGAGSFLKFNRFSNRSRNAPHFMEHEGSLPQSQIPATCLYPEPVRSNPYPHIPLPEDPCYRGVGKSLARPGRKQATATEDFDVHISYL